MATINQPLQLVVLGGCSLKILRRLLPLTHYFYQRSRSVNYWVEYIGFGRRRPDATDDSITPWERCHEVLVAVAGEGRWEQFIALWRRTRNPGLTSSSPIDHDVWSFMRNRAERRSLIAGFEAARTFGCMDGKPSAGHTEAARKIW